MANPGFNDTTTPTGTTKSNSQSILVVILVVVLSILVLCLTGIVLVVYYRRRMQGKKYTRLHPSAESSDITAIDNSNPSPSAWNSFLRYIPFLRSPASPDQYAPVQLSNGRPPPKVSVQFGDPNLPRSPPITETSSSVPRRPAPRQTATPAIMLPSRTPRSPNRNFTAPIISQSVVRIAPLPDSSTPRAARPVRAPSAPIILPTREPSPLRPLRLPIEVLNISRPSNFTIDDTPSPSAKGLGVGKRRDYQRQLPNGTLHGQSRSDGHIATHRQEPVELATSPARRSSLSTQSGTRSQDSDSVVDQRPARIGNQPTSHDASLQTPISEASSASTTASIAGSSRPPTLTIKNLLKSVNPAQIVLPSLHLPGPLSLSLPSSGRHTPNQVPSQTLTPPRAGQHAAQSQSPPHHHTQFGESQRDRQPSHTSQYPQDRIRRHPSETQLGDQRGATRPANDQEQGGLFPQAVISAGYQTRRGPNPLLPVAADSRRFAPSVAPPTAVPPPTPNSWAPLRTNRI